MFAIFRANAGFMGTPTHNFAIDDFQMHQTQAGLQKFIRKQPVSNQAQTGTRIQQFICNHYFSSTPYSHFQVQLLFVSMMRMGNSHGMQLWHAWVRQ